MLEKGKKLVEKIRINYKQKDPTSKFMINILTAGTISLMIMFLSPYAAVVIAVFIFRSLRLAFGTTSLTLEIFDFTSHTLVYTIAGVAFWYFFSVFFRNSDQLLSPDIHDYTGGKR